ncbi:MAG: 3-oxoadipate enol-lactonase [Bryobacteraceae bacterium]
MTSDLFTDITGPENRPVIVFSHALGGDLSMWNRQVTRFADAHRILRYDLRGHGRSPQAASPLKLEDLGADVLELLDHHGIERAHFCGLSLGGLIGQWLGLNAPERLLTLTLADTAPRMGSPEQWDERIQQIERGGMSAIAGATMERWFTEAFRKAEPETVAHVRSVLEATSPAGYIASAKVVREGLGGNIEEISVPTLVATGTFDAAAKPEESSKMAARIPRSRYAELNAAHISPLEASGQFNDALAAFLEEQAKDLF